MRVTEPSVEVSSKDSDCRVEESLCASSGGV